MPTGISGLYKNTKGAKEAEKRNKERERLVELLTDAGKEVARIFKIESENCLKRGEIPQHSKTIREIEADHLLANGVRVEIPNNSVSLVDGHIEEKKG